MTTLATDARMMSASERERRAAALQRLLVEENLDALVLAGADYRGHKGTLRWVGDYNLSHRYGFALVVPGGEPELLLPENLGMGRPGGAAGTAGRPLRSSGEVRRTVCAEVLECGGSAGDDGRDD